MNQWFYVHQRQPVGPVAIEHLRELARKGELLPQTPICQKGSSAWTPAASVAELSGCFPAGPVGAASAPASSPPPPPVQPAVNPSPIPATAKGGTPRRSVGRLPTLPKPIVFGLLGVLGSLAGCLIGEGVLLAFPPGDRSSDAAGPSLVSRPEPPAAAPAPAAPSPPAPSPPLRSPPPLPAEFQKRLTEAGGKTGEVQITLIWNNRNDLDLHCMDPSGTEIYFKNKKAPSGGELDVDRNAKGETDKPVENIRWLTNPPIGKYKVYVHHYGLHGGTDPTAFTVNVLASSSRQEFSGAISYGDSRKMICEFEIGPELFLAAPGDLVMYQGGGNRLPIRIAREYFSAPVVVKVTGDLSGLTAREATLKEEQDQGELEVTADSTAHGGMHEIVLTAVGGGARAEARLQVNVQVPPPALRLAAPREAAVKQGGVNRLPIVIAREHFSGPVGVSLSGDLSGLSSRKITLDDKQSEAELEFAAAWDARAGERQLTVSAAGGGVESETQVQVQVTPVARWAWRPIVAAGCWTGLLAAGLSLALVMGQNRNLGRPLLRPRNGLMLAAAGAAAGFVAGAIGQVLFGLLSLTTLPVQAGFLLSWLFLGGLLGWGVGLFIPNLPGGRAGIAGMAGGVLGAAAFLGLSVLGDEVGRLAGAAILGFGIGLMVALAELAYRRWWLEVAFGPREVRTVTLGAEPVSVGGEDRRGSVFVRDAPPVAFRYRIEQDRVLCEDAAAGQTREVQAGDSQTLGGVTITVCSAASAVQSGYSLQLVGGKSIPLNEGMPLTEADLPGLQPQGADGVVALVSRRPGSPAALVLRNRSSQNWILQGADGVRQTIEPGRGVELAPNLSVDFGGRQGRLVRAAKPPGSSTDQPSRVH